MFNCVHDACAHIITSNTSLNTKKRTFHFFLSFVRLNCHLLFHSVFECTFYFTVTWLFNWILWTLLHRHSDGVILRFYAFKILAHHNWQFKMAEKKLLFEMNNCKSHHKNLNTLRICLLLLHLLFCIYCSRRVQRHSCYLIFMILKHFFFVFFITSRSIDISIELFISPQSFPRFKQICLFVKYAISRRIEWQHIPITERYYEK